MRQTFLVSPPGSSTSLSCTHLMRSLRVSLFCLIAQRAPTRTNWHCAAWACAWRMSQRTCCASLGGTARPFSVMHVRSDGMFQPHVADHLLAQGEVQCPLTLPDHCPTPRKVGPISADVLAYLDSPCVLCGYGDSSTIHWVERCPVLALSSRILGNTGVLERQRPLLSSSPMLGGILEKGVQCGSRDGHAGP